MLGQNAWVFIHLFWSVIGYKSQHGRLWLWTRCSSAGKEFCEEAIIWRTSVNTTSRNKGLSISMKRNLGKTFPCPWQSTPCGSQLRFLTHLRSSFSTILVGLSSWGKLKRGRLMEKKITPTAADDLWATTDIQCLHPPLYNIIHGYHGCRPACFTITWVLWSDKILYGMDQRVKDL